MTKPKDGPPNLDSEHVAQLAHELAHDAALDAMDEAGPPSAEAIELEAFVQELAKLPPGLARRGASMDLASGSFDGEPEALVHPDTARMLAMSRAELLAHLAAHRVHVEPALVASLSDGELRERVRALRPRA